MRPMRSPWLIALVFTRRARRPGSRRWGAPRGGARQGGAAIRVRPL